MPILGALCNFSMCLHLQFLRPNSSLIPFGLFLRLCRCPSLNCYERGLISVKDNNCQQPGNSPTRYFLYLSTHSPLTEARKMPSTTTTKYLDFKNFNPYFLSKLISMLNLVRPRYWPHTCDVVFCYLALSIKLYSYAEVIKPQFLCEGLCIPHFYTWERNLLDSPEQKCVFAIHGIVRG